MSSQTFCSDLWDGFAIIANGDVFSCCLLKPIKIGNIYDDKLRELINSNIIKEYREKSINEKLECYDRCNFVRKDNTFKDLSSIELDIKYEDLKRIHISFGEKCNINCIMCKHPKRFAESNQILDYKLIIKNIDITPFEEILIQGGEPLYIKNCQKYLAYLSDIGKKYMLLTNATLINEKWARKLAIEAKSVVISINGATKEVHERVNIGSNFDKVLTSISYLKKYKEILNSNLIIFGRMTITIHNIHEVPLFLNNFERIGFNKINFGYDRETVPSYLNQNQDAKDYLRKNITKNLKLLDVNKIDLQRLYQLNLVGDIDHAN